MLQLLLDPGEEEQAEEEAQADAQGAQQHVADALRLLELQGGGQHRAVQGDHREPDAQLFAAEKLQQVHQHQDQGDGGQDQPVAGDGLPQEPEDQGGEDRDHRDRKAQGQHFLAFFGKAQQRRQAKARAESVVVHQDKAQNQQNAFFHASASFSSQGIPTAAQVFSPASSRPGKSLLKRASRMLYTTRPPGTCSSMGIL